MNMLLFYMFCNTFFNTLIFNIFFKKDHKNSEKIINHDNSMNVVKSNAI